VPSSTFRSLRNKSLLKTGNRPARRHNNDEIDDGMIFARHVLENHFVRVTSRRYVNSKTRRRPAITIGSANTHNTFQYRLQLVR